ncbi:MAG: hypothetical protein KA368_09560, partial [Acidobacteria bacterium]|nr:hypothetical protein [Acidobacteriota bacterium]
ADRGRIGIAMAMPVGKAIARGERELVICEFAPIANRKGLPLMFDFGDFPVRREMADVESNLIIGNFSAEGLELETLSAELYSSTEASKQLLALYLTDSEKNRETMGKTELSLREATTVMVVDSNGKESPAKTFWLRRGMMPFTVLLEVSSPITEGTATIVITNSNGDKVRLLIEINRYRSID